MVGRTITRAAGGVAAVLTMLLSTGCAAATVAGTPVTAAADPRAAFGAFARPAQPTDRLPDHLTISGSSGSTEPDARKVASWPGTDVFLAFAPPDMLCLMVDTRPGPGATGGVGCGPASTAADRGMGSVIGAGDSGTLGVVLIPDGATATMNGGVIVAVGDGVIGVQPDQRSDGIDITLTFADGHTAHLDLTPR